MVDQGAYYFVASDGRRGDIIRCETYQPGIPNEDDYYFYMWVHASQGYFVLKQRFIEGLAQRWQLIGELETDRTGPSVFEDLSELVKKRYSIESHE